MEFTLKVQMHEILARNHMYLPTQVLTEQLARRLGLLQRSTLFDVYNDVIDLLYTVRAGCLSET